MERNEMESETETETTTGIEIDQRLVEEEEEIAEAQLKGPTRTRPKKTSKHGIER